MDRTPYQWFTEQQERAEMLSVVEGHHYFCDPQTGANALLTLLDGLRSLLAYCLAASGVKVILKTDSGHAP